MKKVNLKKNYFYSLLLQITTILIPIITAPYTARVFGADGVGVMSYTSSILSIFMLFAVLGTQGYGQKAIAQCRDDREKVTKTFWEIELISICSTLVCLVVWVILICFSKDYKAFYIVHTLSLLASGLDITWFYYGFEEFKGINLRSIAIKLVGLVCLFVFARSAEDLLLYVGLLAATGLIGNIALWIPLKKYVGKVGLKTLQFGEHFKSIIVFFIPTIATSIYTILDKTMLGLYSVSKEENGYYEQTSNIVKLCWGLANAQNAIMVPHMAYLFAKDGKDKLKSALNTSMEFSVFLTIPLVFGLDAVASTFIPIYLGEEFVPVIKLIYVYTLLVVPIAISCCVHQQLFIAIGKNRYIIIGNCCGAVLNLVLNLLLIPKHGAMGATISSVASETFIASLALYNGRKYISFRNLFLCSYKKVIASVLMFFAVWWISTVLPHNIPVLVLMIVVGVTLYFGLILVLRDNMGKYVTDYLKSKFGRKEATR